MNRRLVAGFAAALFSSAPVFSEPVRTGPNPVIYNWSGWYIGGQAGYGWARSQETLDPPYFGGFYVNAQCTVIPKDCVHDLRGFIGGGYTGFNVQNGNWIVGFETSYSGAHLSGAETIDLGSGTNSFTTKITSLLLATGRFGYARDHALFYAKAGYAGGDVRFTAAGLPSQEIGTSAEWHNGWALGGGLEYALTPNWIVGVEYIFADLGNLRRFVTGSFGSVAPVAVDVGNVQLVLARVSYKFGGP